jgi:hypothetical protein
MTVIINGTDNSASTPAVTGTDGDTGMFYPAANTVALSTGGSERMRVDSSGNVGIGTTSPGRKLDVSGSIRSGGSTNPFVALNNGTVESYFEIASSNTRVSAGGANALTFFTNDAERMRIDSSGNITAGGTAAFANYARISYGGGTASFQNTQGATAGIGGTSGGTTNNWIQVDNAQLYPTLDDARDCGAPSFRWDDVYATNGTIQTSDRNEKQDIEELTEAETRVAVAAKGLLRKYRWKKAVSEKGDDARIHFGIIAQDLQAAFEAEGLDAGRYAMFINSEWTDEETGEQHSRMGVRYNELLAFIIAAI